MQAEGSPGVLFLDQLRRGHGRIGWILMHHLVSGQPYRPQGRGLAHTWIALEPRLAALGCSAGPPCNPVCLFRKLGSGYFHSA